MKNLEWSQTGDCTVTPAKAGVQEVVGLWQLIRRFELVDSCLRRNDKKLTTLQQGDIG